MATQPSISPDAIETREIADLSAEITVVLTASLASAVAAVSGGNYTSGASFAAAITSLTASLNAGVLLALSQARQLSKRGFNATINPNLGAS